MSVSEVTERIAEASPRSTARIAGVFYLLTILTAAFAEAFVRGRLVVSNDAAATATNILAHESLYRLGAAADLINLACYVVVTALFFKLFMAVNRNVSLLAAFFSLVACAILAVHCLFHLAPLFVLGGAQYLSVFRVEQLQALALMLLKLQAASYSISIVFFGFYCLLIGYLVFSSTFLPRILGALMALAGLCYLIGMFARFLSPAFSAHLFPYILWPGLLGEGSLTLWLLLPGVNVQRWREQANS